MRPPTEHIQSLSKESIGHWTEVGPLYFAPFSTSWIKFAIEGMIFYALFSLYQLNWADPPWWAFKASKDSANSTWIVPYQLSTRCVTASQNIVTKIYCLNMFWSMSLRSFVWVLDACYRCGRPCIMEMSWLLSVTSFFVRVAAFFHGDIFMLSDHIFHQRS